MSLLVAKIACSCRNTDSQMNFRRRDTLFSISLLIPRQATKQYTMSYDYIQLPDLLLHRHRGYRCKGHLRNGHSWLPDLHFHRRAVLWQWQLFASSWTGTLFAMATLSSSVTESSFTKATHSSFADREFFGNGNSSLPDLLLHRHGGIADALATLRLHVIQSKQVFGQGFHSVKAPSLLAFFCTSGLYKLK